MEDMERTRAYIAPDILLSLLIKKDCKVEKEVLLREDVEIVSSMFGMYEALACIEDAKELNLENLLLILKHVAFVADEISDELLSTYKMSPVRKKHLREVALSARN